MHQEAPVKVLRVPIKTPTLWPYQTANSFLIGNEREALLVDAGYDLETTKTTLEQALAEHGLATPTKIVLTHAHPDHAPGVRQLTHWNATVYCHESEAEAIAKAISPYEQIEFLEDGEKLFIAGEEIEVIHGPGHTVGQLNLYIPAQRILIAGDNIVSEGTTWIGPPEGDMRDYLNTLQRLKQLKAEKIGPGHGDWVTTPEAHIDFVLQRRLHRETQIQDLLREHGQLTAKQLTEKIYADSIHPSIFGVAERTTIAHLIKLIADGHVVQEKDKYALSS